MVLGRGNASLGVLSALESAFSWALLLDKVGVLQFENRFEPPALDWGNVYFDTPNTPINVEKRRRLAAAFVSP